jgi:hypothetical protein
MTPPVSLEKKIKKYLRIGHQKKLWNLRSMGLEVTYDRTCPFHAGSIRW